jgi:hypothetical protein
MATINSGTPQKTPRLILFRDSSENQRSIRFNHEELVAVK